MKNKLDDSQEVVLGDTSLLDDPFAYADLEEISRLDFRYDRRDH